MFQEYYEVNQLIEHHAARIKFMSQNYPVYTSWIDPTTQKRDAITGRSVRGEYLRHGVPVVLGNNDIMAGIHKVSAYFKQKPDGKPRLVISEKCEHLIEELTQYRWEESKPDKNEPEKPHPYKDHTCDALRYLVMGLPLVGDYQPAATDYVPPPLQEFYEDGEEDLEDVEVYSGLV